MRNLRLALYGKDQDAMEERCDACPVMQKLDHLAMHVLGVGRSFGTVDAVIQAVGVLLDMEDRTCERVQELRRMIIDGGTVHESD